MVFEGCYYCSSDIDDGRNMYWDVKDFNCPAARKSPNFVVIAKSCSVQAVENGKQEGGSKEEKAIGNDESLVEPACLQAEGDEDSEDEL